MTTGNLNEMTGTINEFEVPVGFKVDIGEIQDVQYREESDPNAFFSKEPPADPKEAEDPPDITTDEVEDGDENPYSDYSEAALIAISEIRDGSFEGIEEKDIPKDLNPESLRQLYRKSNELRLKEEINGVRELAGEAGKYVEYLLNGGDPNAVKDAINLQDLIKLDTNNEENQKLLIAKDFKRKGVDEDEIDELVENILDKGKGKQKADQIQDSLKKEENSILEEAKLQREEYENQQKELYDRYVSNVKTTIQKAEINGVKISKQEQKALESAIFNPTEIIEVQNPDTGKPQKIRATKIQVLQNELNNDYEKLVSFFYWLHKGGKFDFVKEQAREEEQDSLRSLLQGRSASKLKNKTENGQDNLLKALQGKK